MNQTLLLEDPEAQSDNTQVLMAFLKTLKKDMKKAAVEMSNQQARWLVDYYYAVQDFRIQAFNERRASKDAGEVPAEVMLLMGDSMKANESMIKSAMDIWSEKTITGRWSKSIKGIGPVLAAGLIANLYENISPEKTNTAGKIWSFAGLNPDAVWEKGQKRPFNARLKVLCWKMGESFVKVSGYDDDVYGHLYQKRKAYEQIKNEAGDYAEQAEKGAQRVRKDTEAYKFYSKGILSPGHIHARSKRWAVKIFLSHWFQVAYYEKTEELAPKPFAISILGHADEIKVPNWPF